MKRREKVYPDAPFPVERLTVANGRVSASAHKNQYTPLHLDWDFYITFQPMALGETTYETAMHVEIETRDIRHVGAFAGMVRHDTERDLNIGSFYLFDHRPSCETRFRVHAVRGNKLDIETEIEVDVGDSYVARRPPLRKVHVRTEVLFEGILVSSYGVQCAPDEEKLIRVAEKLFDVSAFAPPRHLPDPYGKGTLNLHFDPLS